MTKWSFPSRANGDTEGFNNSALEWFKGNPLCALAREVCQNSLDAQNDDNDPVEIVFKKHLVDAEDFPGMDGLRDVLYKCREFWPEKGNEKAHTFIDKALSDYNSGKISVLRISDYNTTGLEGAYDEDSISSWRGLVKGSAFSAKGGNNAAAGSFGIGKSAPFINSKYQTVFYRTQNLQGEKAVQGVAHLMAFKDESYGDMDPVRRSVGYFGNAEGNMPVQKIDELDQIDVRTETGTDLFIPGFISTIDGDNDWKELMIGEILENFLMAIEYNNLSVSIDGIKIDRDALKYIVGRYSKYAKNANSFNRILQSDDDNVVEEVLDFHGLGQARLRLMYANDLNKKILIVRKSGMKIAEIKNLPKGISYTGILELQGEKLNEYFRNMENPTHDKWEPKRHPHPDGAKRYKNELEEWVRDTIRKKIEEQAGAESLIDTGNMFNYSGDYDAGVSNPDTPQENVLDTTKSVEVVMGKPRRRNTSSSAGDDDNGGSGNKAVKGMVDNAGNLMGHRNGKGKRPLNATGRRGLVSGEGEDSMYAGMSKIAVHARIISAGNGENRLIFTPSDGMKNGEISIVATGENGKTMPLNIDSIVDSSHETCMKNGKIIVKDVNPDDKVVISFRVHGKQTYAMGVNVNGN
ncbi:hypothetical protein [Butyrivibrio sp. AE3009]|uniref:hypothetical protein n=1 Tax=Butyrivibrio sp. AE3009 TaxID=1280666 RepID=UPI0003B321E4|nr:hypothetical protein [Butyrivibrio sp. AE3009]